MFKLVNFAQKKAYLTEDETFQTDIKDKVINKYRLNLKTGNKYYKFLEEKDLPVLKKYEHRICFNLKQKPTYLFLTTFQKQKFCLYFDVEMKEIFSVKQRFDEDLFDDTLIEGELLKVSQQHYIYLISDLLVYHGNINTMDLDKKISLLQEIVGRRHRPDPGFDPCQLLVKDFIEYKYLNSFMTDYYLTAPYRQYISGLIFRPLVKSNRNIITVLDKHNFHKIQIPDINTIQNTETDRSDIHDLSTTQQDDEDITELLNSKGTHGSGGGGGGFSLQTLLQKFQEKDNDSLPVAEQKVNLVNTKTALETKLDKTKKHKIDYKKHEEVTFELRRTEMPDVYQLWLLDEEDKLYKYGIACIPTRESSEFVKTWFTTNTAVIVVCKYMKNFSKWQPVKISSNLKPDNIKDIRVTYGFP